MDAVDFTRQGPQAPIASSKASPSPPSSAAPTAAADDGGKAPASSTTLLPYASPVIAADSTTGALVLSFRDQTTGQALYQYPSKTALQYQTVQNHQAGVKSVNPDQTG